VTAWAALTQAQGAMGLDLTARLTKQASLFARAGVAKRFAQPGFDLQAIAGGSFSW
jgi:hypothetical protein